MSQKFCNDPRHDEPCQLPCRACDEDECGTESTLTKFTVRLARDLSEYCDVEVEAETEEEAEDRAIDHFENPDLPPLQWDPGTDREDPYVADIWESNS